MKIHDFLQPAHIVLLSTLLLSAAFPSYLSAEFYKYRDKNGRLHFVDDIGKIPAEYREDLDIYKEKTDFLSPEEKEAYLKQQEIERQQKKAAEQSEKIRSEQLQQAEKNMREKNRQDKTPLWKQLLDLETARDKGVITEKEFKRLRDALIKSRAD